MKKFLLSVIVFLLLTASFMLLLLAQADGYTDAFYLRFTSPQQSSLILGTSRAAQGLMPDVIEEVSGRKNIFNYSFTNRNSPYGEVYYNSILRKLDPRAKDGVFILSVDPWSLSTENSAPDDTEVFRERGLTLEKMTLVNMRPNFQYMLRCYDGQYLDLLRPVKERTMELHANGWLEISVPMDSGLVSKRTQNKMEEYQKFLPEVVWSATRLEWLGKITDKLRQHGTVILVRLPVYREMQEIEASFVPDFDERLQAFAAAHSVEYFSLMEMADSCQFTDGNHLYKESSREVSRRVAEKISGR